MKSKIENKIADIYEIMYPNVIETIGEVQMTDGNVIRYTLKIKKHTGELE